MDKQGDIIPSSEIERAAHDFIINSRQIDSDHDCIPGKGIVVESWILKSDQEFELCDGSMKEYPKGTWILGVKFNEKTWQRIKAGELNGFSAYGTCNEIDIKHTNRNTVEEKKMELEIEVFTPEENFPMVLLGKDNNIRRNGVKTKITDGVYLVYPKRQLIKKEFDGDFVFRFVIEIMKFIGAKLIADKLWDKIKDKKVEILRIDKEIVEFEEGKIKRVIKEKIEKKFK